MNPVFVVLFWLFIIQAFFISIIALLFFISVINSILFAEYSKTLYSKVKSIFKKKG